MVWDNNTTAFGLGTLIPKTAAYKLSPDPTYKLPSDMSIYICYRKSHPIISSPPGYNTPLSESIYYDVLKIDL